MNSKLSVSVRSFTRFMGRRQGESFSDPRTRLGCKFWLERVLGYYGEKGGVDIEIIDGQLGICARTVEFLYAGFTPLRTRYVPGSRPVLERIVADTLSKGMSDRKKALALMRRCRDARDHGIKAKFDGGTEEELLKRGGGMCNEISRVFFCLCQVAGLPARAYSAHISGHMMAEVYADGRWSWIDPYFGLAPVSDDGRPASAWELLQDPTLFERQPQKVWDDLRPPGNVFGGPERASRNLMYWMARFRDCYFNPLEAASLGNYFVWEHAGYTYPWRTDAADEARLREGRRREALNRQALGWPEWFANPLVFNETVHPRGR